MMVYVIKQRQFQWFARSTMPGAEAPNRHPGVPQRSQLTRLDLDAPIAILASSMTKQRQKQTRLATKTGKSIPAAVWSYLIIALAVAGFLYNCYGYNLTQDDAYISFRYAANFLAGEGLVYNHGEHVEGYTNFLWVMLLALFKGVFGVDYVLASRFLGVAAGAVIFYLIYLLLKHHFERIPVFLQISLALMLLGNLSLPYWSVASLETSAFACMALAAIVAEYRRPQLTPALLIIATLLRPEGALVFGVILIYRIISERKLPVLYILMYVVPLLPFAVFKLAFYGSLFPNPYYAKSGVGLEYIQSGLEYLWHFARTVGVYGVIFVAPLLMIRRLWSKYSLIYIYVLLYVAYIVWVGGDVLKVYRFFVPVAPALYFIFAMSVLELMSLVVKNRQRIVTPVLLAIVGFTIGSYVLSREHVRAYGEAERNIIGKMHFVTTMLKKHMGPDFSLAASTIGMSGYQLLGQRVIDMLGLTDAFIARNPEQVEGMVSSWKEQRFNARYLLEQQPDFILFSTGYKPSAPAERALMLHSEFRRRYHTVGFLRENAYKVVWMRKSKVDMTRDVVHTDFEFVNKLSDGIYHLSHSTPDVALSYLRESRRRLGEDYPVLSYTMGECFQKMNQMDSAMVYFQQALQIDSLCWEARANLVVIANQTGDTATANRNTIFLQTTSPWLFDRSYVPLRASGEGD